MCDRVLSPKPSRPFLEVERSLSLLVSSPPPPDNGETSSVPAATNLPSLHVSCVREWMLRDHDVAGRSRRVAATQRGCKVSPMCPQESGGCVMSYRPAEARETWATRRHGRCIGVCVVPSVWRRLGANLYIRTQGGRVGGRTGFIQSRSARRLVLWK